ncbi:MULTISPECIES: hypothetical protein [unclassified Sphingomonas]|nr:MULTISPECIES: hypothetical protein [unclassified Sphingomonas]
MDAVVMVADADAFEASYVSATLGARGVQVLGPFAELTAAQLALDSEPQLTAAVIGQPSVAAAAPLTAALQRRGVPYLLLLPYPSLRSGVAEAGTPRLIKPFAAYQVADWVAGVLADQESATPSPEETIRLRAM